MTEPDVVDQVRAEVERQHMSGRALAVAMGLPNTTVRHILYDRDVPLTVGRLLAVSKALGRPAVEIAPQLGKVRTTRTADAAMAATTELTIDELVAVAQVAGVSPLALVPALGR